MFFLPFKFPVRFVRTFRGNTYLNRNLIYKKNMISYDRIKLFFDRKDLVHISCDGRFYNGKIIEVYEDRKFLILIDNKLGEVPILFEEILNIEPYMKEGE